MPSSSFESQNTHLQALLQSARPFLRGQLENVDSNLPKLIAVLKSVGAGECWHKHGSFLDHLIDIYRILKLWHTPDAVCLTGLFHSAYSNSYVNLAIFDPSTGRDTVRQHVGDVAEHLIHLFCIVPRQKLMHDDLLFKYDDITQLTHHVMESGEKVGRDEEWRVKIRSVLPYDGIVMKHIKTGEDVCLSRRVVAVFLLMTIADFSDQLFGFQDVLFENTNGMLRFEGNNVKTALWPGDGKPGLWMSSLSRMGAIYRLIVREEELYLSERGGRVEGVNDRDEDIELVIPPIFDNCTKVLSAEDQIEARELYWEGVCGAEKRGLDGCEEVLRKSVEKNPFVGEPHVVLGQIYLSQGRFQEAEKESEEGLRLLLEWGSPWDQGRSLDEIFGGSGSKFFFPKAIFQVYRNFRGVETAYTEIFLHENYIPPISQKKFRGGGRPPPPPQSCAPAWDKRMSWEGWIAWCRVLVMKAKEKSWPETSSGIINLGLVR